MERLNIYCWIVGVLALTSHPAFAGTIIIQQLSSDYVQNSAARFEYSPDLSPHTFFLVNQSAHTEINVSTGKHSFRQLAKDNWKIANISCTSSSGAGTSIVKIYNSLIGPDANPGFEPADDSVEIELSQDKEIVCTFSNQILLCGNGTIEPPETCDSGGLNSDTAPDACRSTCTVARCGDGVLDRLEECEDSNPFDGDGCDSQCRQEGVIEIHKLVSESYSSHRSTGPAISTSFEFNASFFPQNFLLNDGESQSSGYIQPGLYSVEEVNIPYDSELEDIYCKCAQIDAENGLLSPCTTETDIRVQDNKVTINLPSKTFIRCTFENESSDDVDEHSEEDAENKSSLALANAPTTAGGCSSTGASGDSLQLAVLILLAWLVMRLFFQPLMRAIPVIRNRRSH